MKKIALFSSIAMMTILANPAQAATKSEMVNACVTQVTEKNITDNSSAQKLCTCTINEQAKITQAQKTELDNWVKSGKNVSDNSTYQRIVAKMKACGNGIKFNQ